VRPLRLILEGFTCFKDRQPPLDFSGLSLFAISGPTGAGKSSLLDAMIFALYGKVPRLRKGYSELISLGRDRLSVVLDFRLGERDYRVARAARRGKSAEAQLEKLDGEGEKTLAGGVTAVDEEIRKLLGLRYEAFTQAVVLPQGEFARFLKSPPGERREILRDLLRLQVYERMRERASKQADALSQQVRSGEERLAQDYAGVTPESLAGLERSIGEIKRRNQELAVELELEGKRVGELRLLYEKTKELRVGREQAAELSRREPEMSARERRLEAAAKAAELLPLLEQALQAESQAARDREQAEAAGESCEQRRSEQDSAAEALERARRAATEIPALRERLRALDEVTGLLAPLETARARLARTGKERERMDKELSVVRKEAAKLAARVKKLEETLAGCDDEAAALGYDEALDARLDAVRERAAELSQARQRARQTEAQATAAEKEAQKKAALAAAEKKSAERAEEELHRVVGERDEAEARQRQAERENLTEALRRAVVVGERCPVCSQTIKKLPVSRQLSLLDQTAASLEEVEKKEEAARQRAMELAGRASEAAARAGSAADLARLARQEAERLGQLVRAGEKELAAGVGKDIVPRRGVLLEEQILEAAKRMGVARKKYREALERRAGLEREMGEVRGEAASRQQAAEALSLSLERASAEMKETEEELERLRARIAGVTTEPDPAAERRKVAARIDRMETELKQAEQKEREAATALSAARSAQEAAERAAGSSDERAREAHRVATRAARQAGFPGQGAVRESALAEEERASMRREVEQYREERRAVERRVGELEAELAGRELDADSLGERERNLAELGRRREEGLKSEAEKREQLKELRRKIEAARVISERLESDRRGHEIYHQLAEDLGSKRFQAYLLEETFRELVEGASGRLMELSGRYTLDFQEETFWVLDHENAGERRNADTLSGGETFLASLALALELSEQVQRAAGAVNLDSLFIDEGFGTLDPETLDAVAAAIEMLPVGGRMVGIITHIPELTARLPARIVVAKRPEGSRACLELV
jgi:exonuclease SbcC